MNSFIDSFQRFYWKFLEPKLYKTTLGGFCFFPRSVILYTNSKQQIQICANNNSLKFSNWEKNTVLRLEWNKGLHPTILKVFDFFFFHLFVIKYDWSFLYGKLKATAIWDKKLKEKKNHFHFKHRIKFFFFFFNFTSSFFKKKNCHVPLTVGLYQQQACQLW